MIKYFLDILDKNPIIGCFASIGGTIPTFFEDIVFIIQGCSMLIGLAIGIITLCLLIKKIKNNGK